MTTTEMISKYKFIIVRPDGVTESLYAQDQSSPITAEDSEFIAANRPAIMAEIKAIEKAADERRAASAAEARRKERAYDALYNDGGDGYNPHRDSAPGRFKVDTQD